MPVGAVCSAGGALAAAREWFERNSGWAPPDHLNLVEWVADGVCRCPDGCLVAPDEWCQHGLASWWLIVTAPRRGGPPESWDPGLMLPHPWRLNLRQPGAEAAIAAHEEAVAAGRPGYLDPRTGRYVMTARHHWERGSCCDSGCRHCPYLAWPE